MTYRGITLVGKEFAEARARWDRMRKRSSKKASKVGRKKTELTNSAVQKA